MSNTLNIEALLYLAEVIENDIPIEGVKGFNMRVYHPQEDITGICILGTQAIMLGNTIGHSMHIYHTAKNYLGLLRYDDRLEYPGYACLEVENWNRYTSTREEGAHAVRRLVVGLDPWAFSRTYFSKDREKINTLLKERFGYVPFSERTSTTSGGSRSPA